MATVFSCKEPVQRSDRSNHIPSLNIEAYTVPGDSVQAPEVIPAGKPRLVDFKPVSSYPAGNNVVVAGKPQTVSLNTAGIVNREAGKPLVRILHGTVVPCVYPEPRPAERPRFKDEARLNIQYLDVDQGLPSSYIYTIFQDRRGFIWLGHSAGLTRYDSRSFLNFSETNPFLKTAVRCIAEDSEGNLWIGTHKALFKYDGSSFTNYTEESGLPSQAILCLLLTKKGELWASSSNGIFRIEKNKISCYDTLQGLVCNQTIKLFEDDQGVLWCGTEKGLCRFDGKTFISYTSTCGFPSDRISAISQDRDGKIWLGSENGIFRLNGNSLEHFTSKQGLINNTNRSIITGSDGSLWITAYNGGLMRYKDNIFTYFRVDEGLAFNTIWSIHEDRCGNLWIGTDGGGVCRYTARSFKHFTAKDGLDDPVISVHEDVSRRLWVGTYTGGVCSFDGREFAFFRDKDNFSGTVWSMLKDRHGNMWFGLESNGVFKYNGKECLHYTDKEGLAGNNTSCIYQAKNGELWFGGSGGATKFDGRTFTRYTRKQGLCGNNVKAITEDPDGNIIIGTTSGITKFADKRVFWYTDKQGFPANNIKNLLTDKYGNLWIGTIGKGLVKFDGKSFLHFTAECGLSDDNIRSIVEDNRRASDQDYGIWLSTDNGIDHFTNLKSGIPKIRIYKRDDGLKGEDFTSNSGFRDSRDGLWWGSVKSLTMYDSRTTVPKNTLPVLQLNSIILEQTFVDFRRLSDSIHHRKRWLIGENLTSDLSEIDFKHVPGYVNYPQDLKLPHNINNITFNFSATEWLAPHKVVYQYMLDGADKEWRPVTKDIYASYTDLRPGKYTFKVKAKGFSDKWSEPVEYQFEIRPPWWQTLWAFALYALILVVAAIKYSDWRNKALLRRQKELEKIVVERTADVVEEKNKVQEKNAIILRKQEEILDSIRYAKRIQQSLLTNEKYIHKTILRLRRK